MSPARSPATDLAAQHPGHSDRARTLLLTASATTVVAALVGWFACEAAQRLGMGVRRQGEVFSFIYTTYERPHFFIVGLFGLGVLTAALIGRRRRSLSARTLSAGTGRWALIGLALLVACAAGAGTRLVCHDYAFSMDEFAATFQARIFSGGHLQASLPDPWRRFAFALSPVFISVDRTRGTWTSTYLPVYAAIRAAFLRAHLESWTNPVLSAAAVLALAAIARRLWPLNARHSLAAALLLATSPQFLLTSMTAYAMPASLLFSLVWLILYLRGTRLALGATPWLGVIAMGVNNPLPHLLFAVPFLLRLVRSRRWGWASYFAFVYLMGFAAWWFWLSRINLFGQGMSGLAQFSFPSQEKQWLQQLMQLTLVFSWLSPAVGLLFVAGLASWRKLPPLARDLAFGVALTLAVYFWYTAGQGHGWGYRYIYAVLGNIVLLAVFGLDALEESAWPAGTALIASACAIAVAVQLPLRAREAQELIAPFARTEAFIEGFKGCVVAVDPHGGWYAQDLVRNDPFLENDPKVVFANRLRPKRRELEGLFPGCIREVTREDLMRLGFPVFEPRSRE